MEERHRGRRCHDVPGLAGRLDLHVPRVRHPEPRVRARGMPRAANHHLDHARSHPDPLDHLVHQDRAARHSAHLVSCDELLHVLVLLGARVAPEPDLQPVPHRPGARVARPGRWPAGRMLLYAWTLLAPYCLRHYRDFGIEFDD